MITDLLEVGREESIFVKLLFKLGLRSYQQDGLSVYRKARVLTTDRPQIQASTKCFAIQSAMSTSRDALVLSDGRKRPASWPIPSKISRCE